MVLDRQKTTKSGKTEISASQGKSASGFIKESGSDSPSSANVYTNRPPRKSK